jgi:hypothetical protein
VRRGRLVLKVRRATPARQEPPERGPRDPGWSAGTGGPQDRQGVSVRSSSFLTNAAAPGYTFVGTFVGDLTLGDHDDPTTAISRNDRDNNWDRDKTRSVRFNVYIKN